MAAGLCAGFTSLIGQVMPNWAESSFWSVVYNLLGLVNSAFLAYLPAWAGYRAAERFGATPILGGMLGMITGLDGINQTAKVLGLFDEAVPLDSILRAGRGGVLAAVLGVWVLAKVEKWVRKRMPDSLDITFTPICTLTHLPDPLHPGHYARYRLPLHRTVLGRGEAVHERRADRPHHCRLCGYCSCSCPWWPWVCTMVWWLCTLCSWQPLATLPCIRLWLWLVLARWALPSLSGSRLRSAATTV